MDNGPERTARALRGSRRLQGTGTIRVEPGGPWEHPESINGHVRDKLLNIEQFGSLKITGNSVT